MLVLIIVSVMCVYLVKREYIMYKEVKDKLKKHDK
jgi:hypothetical protein